MAYTTINKSSDYFNTKLYTGNGGTQSITGVGFQPDFTWIKPRSQAEKHSLTDAVRGAGKVIQSDTTVAEFTNTDYISSFISDGFSIGSNFRVNTNSTTYASWNWKAGGAGSANTAGSINSTVSANTTSGFSIVSYTGTGSNATVGHGLGVAPKMIYVKGRNTGSTNWLTGGTNISSNWGSSLHLNTTGAIDTYNYWQNQAPNANTFALGTDGANNQSGINFIAYCFADVQGYSKFGSYIGNGSTDGPFVYTGFKPAFVMVKITAGQTDNWIMQDNKINSFNGASSQRLRPNSSGAEFSSSNEIDLLSNGFKTHGNDGEINGSGFSYIYMAFAKAPLVGSNNVPCTAR